MNRLPSQLPWILAILIIGCGAFWLGRRTAPASIITTAVPSSPTVASSSDPQPTLVYAHNLLLRKGPHFRVYIRWIRGQMLRTNKDQNPSFDAPDSFLLEIQKGVVSVKLADIADYLNAGITGQAPLRNISIESMDGRLQLKGTAHKLIPLPVQLDGMLTPLPDGRLQYHVLKLNVLKIPFKGLLGVFHLELSDLIKGVGTPGVEIAGNDIFFDTQRLLPAPHIHGSITSVTASPTELQLIYGGAKNNEERLAQWHNFLQLSGGSLDFGKLTMRQVDLTMIDASQDPWFDLDLVNYQAQLVYGTTRMTAKAGLEIYMPDIDKMPARKTVEAVNLEWLRNRNTSLPLNLPPY